MVALHNFCIWLNDRLGRPRLAFADLLGWRAHSSYQAFKVGYRGEDEGRRVALGGREEFFCGELRIGRVGHRISSLSAFLGTRSPWYCTLRHIKRAPYPIHAASA